MNSKSGVLLSSSPVYQVETWFCSPKSTQGSKNEPITLDSTSIELLFKEYVSYYHRVLPVVEVHRGPEFVYGASAALFWTIMAIASRRRSKDLPVGINFEKLCDVQKQYLSEIAVSPILGQGKSSEFNLPSLYAVQAFLLCTLWPPPTASINADMSWNTSGIAILTAIRAGLHCPGHAHDFERIFKLNKAHRTNLREQLVTWLATNALSQAIANMFGYPSAAKFQAHRQYLFNKVDLPPRVRHMYEIQRNAHEIEQSLGQLGQGNGSPSSELSMTTSLIRVHAARYDQIEAEFGEQMDVWTMFTLYAGRAQLFSYYLFGEVDENGVVALYNSCLVLLNHVVIQPDEYMKYIPVVSIMILWQTASVVARLYHSEWSENLDRYSGEKLYSSVVKKVGLSSVFEHDLPYRAAEIMAQMWGAFRALRRSNPGKSIPLKLSLRSRMSASVFFDSLWAMRESTEIRSHAPTTLSKPTSLKSESTGSSSTVSSASPVPSGTSDEPIPPKNPLRGEHLSMSVSSAVYATVNQRPAPINPPSVKTTRANPACNLVSSTAPSHSPNQTNPPSGPQPRSYTSDWVSRQLPSMESLLSPEPGTAGAIANTKSPISPISPAMSAMIEATWADIDPEAATSIWHDVNAVMEDFGFGLGELPYISP